MLRERAEGVVRGAVAGLAATGPMTAWMLSAHRALPGHERYALPPEQITSVMLRRSGFEVPPLGEAKHLAATSVAHLGYGAAAGGLYGGLAGRGGAATGVMYGLGVWAGSYLALLPSQKILRSATEHPWRRNALMIAAHVVWGAALGAAFRELKEGKRRKKGPRRRGAAFRTKSASGRTQSAARRAEH